MVSDGNTTNDGGPDRPPSSTERLIEGLVGDLRPVRPLPRLSLAAGLVLAAGLLVLGLVIATGGVRADLSAALAGSLVFPAVLAGLVATALCGSLAGLAGAVPGRESVSTVAGTGALVAAASAALIAGVAMLGEGVDSGSPLRADVVCAGWGLGFFVLPGCAALLWLTRGWVGEPRRAAALSFLGTAAIGAAIVHLSCPFAGARHLLLGHCVPPFVVAALAVALVAPLLRRHAR